MRRATKASVVTLALVLCILVSGCNKVAEDSKADSGSQSTAAMAADVQAGIDAYNQGEFSDAETKLAAVVDEDPGNLEARKTLALAYAAQGKNDEAIEQYREVIGIDAEDHVSLYRMALLERLEGSLEDAAGHLERAVELSRDDSYVDELARTYMQLEKYEEAAGAWGSLAEEEGRAPESAAVLLGLQADALRLSGDVEGARAALERALELAPGNTALKAQLEGLGE